MGDLLDITDKLLEKKVLSLIPFNVNDRLKSIGFDRVGYSLLDEAYDYQHMLFSKGYSIAVHKTKHPFNGNDIMLFYGKKYN